MRRKRRRRNRYRLIPLTSFVIFLVCMALGGISEPDTNENVSLNLPSAPDLVRDIAETGLPSEVKAEAEAIKEISVESENDTEVFIQNLTDFDIDMAALLKNDSPVELSPKGVQVLIVHTHGSESYTPSPAYQFEYTENDRTLDTRYNVVRIGDELEEILENNGIETLHIRDIFDSPSYNGSYTRSLNAITEAFGENPSIKVVIDLHRDAMIAKDGTKYKVTADIDGRTAAQLMFVTGSSGGGLVHDNWQKNLTFHGKIQQEMNSRYPGIMRPIVVRDSRFNQHVCTGSMLLEVGTSGNTLDEALYSIQLFGEVLSEMLKET
ncbi:MAG: stage II sporulation protein P [Clostridia bacterium]|nr:stage II sporulation protein P [Clostridia bacterium]